MRTAIRMRFGAVSASRPADNCECKSSPRGASDSKSAKRALLWASPARLAACDLWSRSYWPKFKALRALRGVPHNRELMCSLLLCPG